MSLATPRPNTPPTTLRTEKEQEAATSLMDLQQRYPCSDDDVIANIEAGISSPANSPIEYTNCNASLVEPLDQDNVSIKIEQSPELVPSTSRYGLILLPPLHRQKESAIRSTLDISLPIFGTLLDEEDEAFRRQSAIRLQSEHFQPASEHHDDFHQQRPREPHGKRPTPANRLDQSRQQQMHASIQTQAKTHGRTQVQTHDRAQSHAHNTQAHAHTPATYYLAQAQNQVYSHPRQQEQRRSPQSSLYQLDEQMRSFRQKQKQFQPDMNQHRRSPPTWPEPNNNRNTSPSSSNNQTAFSIYGDGVRTRRTIVHHQQQGTTSLSPASSSSSSPRQNQVETSLHHGCRVVRSPPQQGTRSQGAVVVFRKDEHQEAAQQQAAHCQPGRSPTQGAQRNLDHPEMSHGRHPLNPIEMYHPTDSRQAHPSNYISQQAYMSRDPTAQPQAYRRRHQMYEHSMQHAHQQHQQHQYYQHQQQQQQQQQKLQQQQLRQHQRYQQYLQQQQQHRISQQTSNHETAKTTLQQSMHQEKIASRYKREMDASNDTLPHRLPSQQHQQQRFQSQRQERVINTLSETTSSNVLATEAQEKGLHKTEREEEDDDDDDDEEEEDDDDDDDNDDNNNNNDQQDRLRGPSRSNPAQSSRKVDKRPTKINKKGRVIKEKPRWTPQMRKTLLKTIFSFNGLDDMKLFHWSQISKPMGQSGKACKDQWRRVLLPTIQKIFDRCDHCDQDCNAACPASVQNQQQQKQRNNKN